MLFVVVETICGRHGNNVMSMHYKVSSPGALLLTSLRSEDVILKKSARGYLSFNQSSGCHGNNQTRMYYMLFCF